MPEHKFKTFDRVLCRDFANEKWEPDIFRYYEDEIDMECPFKCIRSKYKMCIPFEENEHLLGTTESPQQKTEFEFGQKVRVWDKNDRKFNAIYVGENTSLLSNFKYIAIRKGSTETQSWICCEAYEW